MHGMGSGLGTEPEYLASALRLLIDAAFVRDGSRFGYAEVSRHLGDVKLSRSRWDYLLKGQHQVADVRLRAALAHCFGVQPHHLTEAGRAELLELLDTELPGILRYRLEKVRNYAARQSAGVSSPAIDQAAEYLTSVLAGPEVELEDLLSYPNQLLETPQPANAANLEGPGSGLLDGKNVLVTGVLSRSSLAFHIAALAQREGANVILSSYGRRMKITRAAARELMLPTPVLELDVSKEQDLASLPDALREHVPVLDGVVHSISGGAPHLMGGRFLEADWTDVAAAMEVSAFSLKALAAAVRPMMPAGSSIVGVTFDSRVSWPLHDWMGVSKAAYESIGRYLARYLGPYGIRCNLVSGAPTWSPALRSVPRIDEFRATLERAAESRAPLGWNLDDPTPTARAVIVLLSDWLTATTGEIIHVDGGVHSTGI